MPHGLYHEHRVKIQDASAGNDTAMNGRGNDSTEHNASTDMIRVEMVDEGSSITWESRDILVLNETGTKLRKSYLICTHDWLKFEDNSPCYF